MYEDEYVPNQCEHIRDTGVRCGSPAMRGRDFCYYHRRLHDSPNLPGDSQYILPALESEHAIQLATTHILRSMLKGKLSRQDAATMFQGIRIARATLRDAKKELQETPITAFEWDLTPGMERVSGESENKCGAAALGQPGKEEKEEWRSVALDRPCGAAALGRVLEDEDQQCRPSIPAGLGDVVADLAASEDLTSADTACTKIDCGESSSIPSSPTGEVAQPLAHRVSVENATTTKISPSLTAATPSGNSQQRRRARRLANSSHTSGAITAWKDRPTVTRS